MQNANEGLINISRNEKENYKSFTQRGVFPTVTKNRPQTKISRKNTKLNWALLDLRSLRYRVVYLKNFYKTDTYEDELKPGRWNDKIKKQGNYEK